MSSTKTLHWTGHALKSLGNLTRDAETLENIYREASNITLTEPCGQPYPQVFVNPRHVHAAASIVQRRFNELQRIKALAADRKAAVVGGAE
jgi:hypothetical protein